MKSVNLGVISKYIIVLGTPPFNRQNVTSSKERTNELNSVDDAGQLIVKSHVYHAADSRP